mmetsp:Transcript_15656/g.49292  ORF Transcript_15656/g.49292 Transcript_15656/m.49292 type:complete len:178 (+) Transcript_15656:62-595(+)
MSGDGLSGKEIPQLVVEDITPFHKKALTITVPSAVLALLLAALAPPAVSRAVGQLGAAYAVGSNVWFLIYGPKMQKVCKGVEWLGNEAFSVIQALLFPDFFAFQTAGCAVALSIHRMLSPTFDLAAGAMAASLAFGLINLLLLAPGHNQHVPRLITRCSWTVQQRLTRTHSPRFNAC